jgi:hypothetical protein
MELEKFIERLDHTTNTVLQVANECPPEQLHVKEEGKWSVLEIIEHLYLTDKVIFTIISRPSETIHPDSEIIGNDKLQKILIEQRRRKISSPAMLQPKGEMKDLNALLQLFIHQRESLKNDLLRNTITIDNRVHHHPLLGAMTIADWLNFTTHHTQRHLEQIKDIVSR